MAEKKIQPTNPTAVTPEVKPTTEDKTAERKTSARTRRVSARKANGFHGV